MDKVTLRSDTLRRYFPKSYTPKQMEQTIIKLLDVWQNSGRKIRNDDKTALDHRNSAS